MPIPHRRITGKILYTSDKPDRKGRERGREYFTMTIHGDGRRTLRAYVEIDDAPNVMRDVTLSMSAKWKPTDCFVRLSVGDQFKGSTWFRFNEHGAEAEGFTVAEGRFSQTWPLAHALAGFGTHPIQGDGWLCSVVDLTRGPHFEVHKNLLMCSLDHRGATGPMLMGHPVGVPLSFVGRERISVAAGSFDALHFRISETNESATDTRNEPGKHPPYDLWCTADGDYIVLLAYVTGYMMTRYELTELQRFDVAN